MRLFLDTSVLLTAAGSAAGASHFVVRTAPSQGWILLTSPWCVEETNRNIRKLGSKAVGNWHSFLQPGLTLVLTELAFDRALVFPKAKDRPVLLSALGASADVLLTRDEADFQRVIGSQIYGLAIRTPGQFLLEQREAGKI